MKICLTPMDIGGVIFIRGMPGFTWPKAWQLRPVAFSQDFIVSLDFFGSFFYQEKNEQANHQIIS